MGKGKLVGLLLFLASQGWAASSSTYTTIDWHWLVRTEQRKAPKDQNGNFPDKIEWYETNNELLESIEIGLGQDGLIYWRKKGGLK